MTLRQALVRAAVAAVFAGGLGLSAVAQPPPPANAPLPKDPGPGPYAVTIEASPGLANHTVYRPTDLGKFGRARLPIVGWGNGGCINGGRVTETFLRKIASHGFFVVSIGPENIG